MKYPNVIDEAATLAAATTNCLARFGDGELSLALGGNCVSQVADPALSKELRKILENGDRELLVGIPNLRSKTKDAWKKYGADKYLALYGKGTFGSSFITRPDSAPWIDTPEYWSKLGTLWRGRDVVLVKGTERSLRASMLIGAGDIREVDGPRRDAFAQVDQILERIGTPHCSVLMCLGATATVLAARLARRGIHAVDLGHVGMFMRHAGAYRYTREDFISPAYQAQLEELHKTRKWGADGAKHLAPVLAMIDRLEPATTLDYGCGEGRLRKAVEAARPGFRVQEYDAGIEGKAGLPKPCDFVVCTDVLEHVEPAKLPAVIDHLFRITGKGAYLVIATRPANAKLPDGRNAHLTVEPAHKWIERLRKAGWIFDSIVEQPGRDVSLCLRKPPL